MAETLYHKDPNERLDYDIDWASLLEDGETIDTSSWAIDPAGELDTDEDDISGTRTKVWLLAGTVGNKYRVSNGITTSEGRIFERSFRVKVVDR